MKKLLLLTIILFIGGCNLSELNNTPTKQVEIFFNKYQTLHEDVLNDLNNVTLEEERFNDEQRKEYRDIMKKHYQNLKYAIKDEEIDGDNAKVKVEIEVDDYYRVLAEADVYLENHPDEFRNSNGEYDASKFMDYRLKKLKENKEMVKYTLELSLTKKDGKWQLNKLTDIDKQKINGVFVY